MVILHIASLSTEKFIGPNINVPKNVIYGNKYNKVALYNLNGNDIDSLENNKTLFKNSEYKIIDLLPEPFNNPDIVIFQGVYIYKFINIANKLKKKSIPYVITPRCSLTSAAQKKRSIKKIMGNFLFFNNFIKNAASINFLTKNEYLESKKFKFKDYYINGNGIELPKNTKKYNANVNDKFIVNFIGRIDWYHKGLDYLIEAINLGKNEFRKNNFKFNLYGPNRGNSVEKIQELIRKYNISDLIEIKEQVYDLAKEKVLLDSDLFIHTSRLEGQPTSVIEAISYGIPVFVTPGTNITDIVNKNKLGFTTEFNINEIKNKLLDAYNKRIIFEEISKREIEYSKNNFDWNHIIEKNIQEYKKVIGG